MMLPKRFIATLVVTGAAALPNGVAKTPPLGWSSWLTCEDGDECGHDVCNEEEVKSSALAMQSNGMHALGWKYMVLDDCWAYSRNASTGALTWDAARFPSGIPALIDWLHARDFAFGLYTSAGHETCSSGGRNLTVPGSLDYYTLDAATFAGWGVDYVKLDWCGDVKKELWRGSKLHREFAAAMNATGRPMVLEVVAGFEFLGSAIEKYANTWRFCIDHHDTWKSTEQALACRALLRGHSTRGGPGGWAYMDVLTTGGAGCKGSGNGAHCPGQTDDEYRTEAAVWALTQSPLLVATDVRVMTPLMSSVLLNRELLAAHQSTATPPGRSLKGASCGLFHVCTLWGRALSPDNSDWMVALVNLNNHTLEVSAGWASLGWPTNATALVHDVWNSSSTADERDAPAQLMTTGVSAEVPPHGTALLRVRRQQ